MKSALLAASALTLLAFGCSSPASLTSRWRSAGAEERHAGSFYIKDQNITVSVQNDGEYLYLSVGVADRMKQRQIFFRGLTVWFDRKGGDEKRFGIQYPLAGDFERGGDRRPDAERTPDTSWTFPENISNELEVLGPGEGEHRRMQMAETKGITAALDRQGETLFYNVRVPLTDNGEHLYGIGAAPGSAVGIGIESGGSMRPPGGEPGGGGIGSGMPGGGMGRGRRGGGGGGGGGGGAEGLRNAPDPIKFWASVTLAAPGGGN